MQLSWELLLGWSGHQNVHQLYEWTYCYLQLASYFLVWVLRVFPILFLARLSQRRKHSLICTLVQGPNLVADRSKTELRGRLRTVLWAALFIDLLPSFSDKGFLLWSLWLVIPHHFWCLITLQLLDFCHPLEEAFPAWASSTPNPKCLLNSFVVLDTMCNSHICFLCLSIPLPPLLPNFSVNTTW